jgi:secreted trypsin-like serine protease
MLKICLLFFGFFLISLATAFRIEGEKRIVGGQEAASEQFPSIASLRNRANDHICGASIISNRWLVTAAHW